MAAAPIDYAKAYHLYRNGSGASAADRIASRYNLPPSGFGAQTRLRAQMWWKDGATPPSGGAAVMVVLHGGGWLENPGAGSAFNTSRWAAYWARRGYVVFTPQYSLIPQNPQSPATGQPDGNEVFTGSTSPPFLTTRWGPLTPKPIRATVERGNCVGRGQVSSRIYADPGLWWYDSVCNVAPNTVTRSGPTGYNAVAYEAQRNVATLVRAIKQSASAVGVNPNHIYVMGESAGGMLAMRLALRSTTTVPSAAEFSAATNGNAAAAAAASAADTARREGAVPSSAASSTIAGAFPIAATDCGRTGSYGNDVTPTPIFLAGYPYQFGPTPPLVTAPGEQCVFSDGTTTGDASITMFHGATDTVIPVGFGQQACTQAGASCHAFHAYAGAGHTLAQEEAASGVSGGGGAFALPLRSSGQRIDIAYRIEKRLDALGAPYASRAALAP